MKLKSGVTLAGLNIKMQPALIAAEAIWKEFGYELVVTSALNGTHSAGSLHYYGYAVDLRTRNFTPAVAIDAANALRKKLGDKYDVINEGSHIHVEYDP